LPKVPHPCGFQGAGFDYSLLTAPRRRWCPNRLERALDAILAEHKRNQLVAEANERFVTTGITIKDVFGKLAK
jgi:hypothetical protein